MRLDHGLDEAQAESQPALGPVLLTLFSLGSAWVVTQLTASVASRNILYATVGTAVVGVVALGSAGVTKGFSSLQALLGVAAVFGAAQQVVTQFLDKRAGEIVSTTSS